MYRNKSSILGEGLVVAWWIAVVAGCGGGTGGEPDAALPDAAQPDAGYAACPAGQVRWPMTLHDDVLTGPAIAGVHGCLRDPTDPSRLLPPEADACGDSDASGVWAPCVPADSDVVFSFDATGYAPTIYPIHTIDGPPNRGRWTDFILKPEGPVETFWQMMGVDYPPTTQGLVWIRTCLNYPDAPQLPPGLGDVAASFDPVAARGPMYTDASDVYDPTATADSIFRPNIWAALDPDPGQTLTLSHPTLTTCGHLDGGWETGDPTTMRLPIVAGYRTYVLVVCY